MAPPPHPQQFFPGGLSQTDWATVGQVGAGTVGTIGSYNLTAYATNVTLQQSQIYQKKNYKLSWISIARQDIRAMMAISVARISNYMLVAVFILTVSANALFFVPSFGKSPDFLLSAFWLSMGLSICFLSMSIMFGVKGQTTAFVNTMRLLTWELRPENPAIMDHDYLKQLQQFEKGGLREILRIPGLMKPNIKTLYGENSPKDISNTNSQSFINKDESGKDFLEDVNPSTKELLYLARFAHFMQLWVPYESNAKYCMGLGLITLSQGGSYFSLGVLSWSERRNGFVLALAMVAIFILMTIMIFHQNFKARSRKIFISVFVLFVWGPLCASFGTFSTLIANPTWVQRVFAPASCFGQTLMYYGIWLISFYQTQHPSYTASRYIEGTQGQKFKNEYLRKTPVVRKRSLLSLPESVTNALFDTSKKPRDPFFCPQKTGLPTDPEKGDPEKGSDQKVDSVNLEITEGADAPNQYEQNLEDETAENIQESAAVAVRRVLLLAGTLWLILALFEIIMPFAANKSEGLKPTPLPLQQVTLSWPSGSMGSGAIACGSGPDLFVANDYQVFRVSPSQGTVMAETCQGLGVNTIADVVAVCSTTDRKQCWPQVLINKADGQTSSFIDCSTGIETPLLQESIPADCCAIGVSQVGTSLSSILIAQHNGELVEYTPSLPGQPQAWIPVEERADLSESAVASMTIKDQHLYLFVTGNQTDPNSATSTLEVKNLVSSSSEGMFELSTNNNQLVAGCVDSNANDVWVLNSGTTPSLWRAKNPFR